MRICIEHMALSMAHLCVCDLDGEIRAMHSTHCNLGHPNSLHGVTKTVFRLNKLVQMARRFYVKEKVHGHARPSRL